MQLNKIHTLSATLELVTGLHIGGSSGEMHIGGIDNTVLKHPYTLEPYIPGSSLKGKMRSLLEWKSGLVAYGNDKLDGKPVTADAINLLENLNSEKLTRRAYCPPVWTLR